MNGMNEENQTNEGSTNETQRPAAFCQHCGKPLDHESKRVVGAAVYCEPCLAARLTGVPPTGGSGTGGYGPTYTGAAWGGVPIATGQPNPGLAALLGLIPGVGAMYNEQYAKGIVHLVIFALLVSFSHVTGIFVLFVFGWLAYMSIEAHHTAKARRDGTPLPNPFGFNDIAERMGFGKAWPGTPDVGGVARDAAQAAAAGFGSVHASFAQGPVPGTTANPNAAAPPPGPAAATPPPAAGTGWGAPVDAYPPAAGPTSASTGYAAPYYGQAYAQSYSPAHPYQYGTQSPYGAPFVPPGGAVPPLPPLPPIVPVPHRFPMGAIWLIGLWNLLSAGDDGDLSPRLCRALHRRRSDRACRLALSPADDRHRPGPGGRWNARLPAAAAARTQALRVADAVRRALAAERLALAELGL